MEHRSEAHVDWQAMSARLLLFAATRMRRIRWRGEARGTVPGGMEPHDLVLGAIRKYLNQERKKPNDISLFSFLCGVIKSDISHLAASAENRSTVQEGADADVQGSARTPFELLSAREERAQLLAQLKADTLACQIATLVIDDGLKPGEIADSLGVPVRDVYNAIKRLRRILRGKQKLAADAADGEAALPHTHKQMPKDTLCLDVKTT